MNNGKKVWFPDLHQIHPGEEPNPSWLHSFWLGIFYSVLFFPTTLWRLIIMPMLTSIVFTVVGMFSILVTGTRGYLHSSNRTEEEALKEIDEFLEKAE